MRQLHYSTPEQVLGYIEQAARIVVEAELTDDLQPIAFTKALDLLSAKHVFVDQADAQPIGVPLMGIPRQKPGR
jgi:hypothetical protein